MQFQSQKKWRLEAAQKISTWYRLIVLSYTSIAAINWLHQINIQRFLRLWKLSGLGPINLVMKRLDNSTLQQLWQLIFFLGLGQEHIYDKRRRSMIIEDYDRMIRIILLTTISCTHSFRHCPFFSIRVNLSFLRPIFHICMISYS